MSSKDRDSVKYNVVYLKETNKKRKALRGTSMSGNGSDGNGFAVVLIVVIVSPRTYFV